MSTDTLTIRLPLRLRRLVSSGTAPRVVASAQSAESTAERGRLSRVADDVSAPIRGEFRYFAW